MNIWIERREVWIQIFAHAQRILDKQPKICCSCIIAWDANTSRVAVSEWLILWDTLLLLYHSNDSKNHGFDDPFALKYQTQTTPQALQTLEQKVAYDIANHY